MVMMWGEGEGPDGQVLSILRWKIVGRTFLEYVSGGWWGLVSEQWEVGWSGG